MMSLLTLFLIGLHTFVAWILIETFVNNAHKLGRASYLVLHYLVVLVVFGGVFWVYFSFVNPADVFWTTIISMMFVLVFEVFVFRYLYSGERWFLNWVDWIVPMFLAASAVYAVGMIVG